MQQIFYTSLVAIRSIPGIGRGALAHRQLHAREGDIAAWQRHVGHAQHKTVGALANVARLDKA
jgi:hypothetical protein